LDKERKLITKEQIWKEYDEQQKTALDYYNLDVTDENSVDDFILSNDDFYDILKKGLPDADKHTFVKTSSFKKLKERLINDHKIFCEIVDKILDNEKITDTELLHIERNLNHKLRLKEEDGNWIIELDIDSGYFLFYKIYDWLKELPKNKKIVKRCEYEGCSNLFIPYKPGKGQRFCSTKCRIKSFQKKSKN
jgi:hypothetical protein